MISEQFALMVAAPAAVWLQAGPRRLRVHSAFTHAINLVSDDGQFLTLLSAEMDDGPFALRLACSRLPEITAGTVARADADTISVGSLHIGWRSAAPWNPALKPLSWPVDHQLPFVNRLGESGSIFVNALLALSPAPPHLRASTSPQIGAPAFSFHRTLLTRATDHLAALWAGLRGDQTALAEAVRGMLGFGPGLTPAGDDCLLGVLAARRMLGEPAGEFESMIAGQAPRATTALSAAFLRSACAGDFAGHWHHLRDALAEDDAAVAEAVGRIARHGASSGADALAGWVAGMTCSVSPRLGGVALS